MELWSAGKALVKGRFEKDWGIAVDDNGCIQAVGPRAQMVATARQVHHYPNRILMPAFVNPHHCGFERLFRPMTDLNASYDDLLSKVAYPLATAVNRDLFEALFRVALAEQAIAGVGTVGEFFYAHNGCYEHGQSGFAERLIRIAVDLGIRLTLVYTFFDQGAEQVKAFIEPMDQSLKAFEELQSRYAAHPLITIIPGVHGLAHTSPDAILAAHALAEKYDTPFHVRLAGGKEDIDAAQEQYGAAPIHALQKMNVLDGRLVVVDGTLLTDEEMDLLHQHDAGMILCPTASRTRGEKGATGSRQLAAGIPFALGSGTLPMFNSYSPAGEIKSLELSQRESTGKRNVLSERPELETPWELAASLPAGMLGLQTASFMPGMAADFILVEFNQPCTKPLFSNPDQPHTMNELLMGWASQASVTHLYIQGKMVVSNGRFGMDLTSSYRMVQKTCDALMENIQKNARA